LFDHLLQAQPPGYLYHADFLTFGPIVDQLCLADGALFFVAKFHCRACCDAIAIID